MTKIFVLDTSVILYDANAINNFDEHDVAVPITVLEELDQFKKGNGVINLQARGFMRELDHLSESVDVRTWAPINGAAKGRFRGRRQQGRVGDQEGTPTVTLISAGRRCRRATASTPSRLTWRHRFVHHSGRSTGSPYSSASASRSS